MNELLDLELDEVSLVDSPANKSATVALYKRDNQMTDETVETDLEKAKSKKKPKGDAETAAEDAGKTLADEMAEGDVGKSEVTEDVVKTLQEELDVQKAEVARLTEALEKADFVVKADVIEKKAPVEYIEVSGEQIVKSSLPEPVLKKLEEAAKEDLRKFAVATLPNFKGTADQRAKLLKSIEGVDEYPAILEALKAADALFGQMMTEVGKSDAETDLLDPSVKLQKMATDRSEKQGVSFEKAYSEVIKTPEGKALLKETYKK